MAHLIRHDSLDDALRESLKLVQDLGEPIEPSKGPARELVGVTIEIANPRSRLSRSAMRGRLFSALGELCWYLSGSDDVEPIQHYIALYRRFAEDGHLWGAYGARMFGSERGAHDQVRRVIELLKLKPDSRQAVVQLFDRHDLLAPHKDVPCTCTLQFLRRAGKLNLVVHMRSNDAYLGFPHDVFTFSMIQELVACTLGDQLGTYVHMVGSFHTYEANADEVAAFLAEGYQDLRPMPPMPSGDPWPSVEALLEFERLLRTSGSDLEPSEWDPYWADLARVLRVHNMFRRGEFGEVETVRNELADDNYSVYFSDRRTRTGKS